MLRKITRIYINGVNLLNFEIFQITVHTNVQFPSKPEGRAETSFWKPGLKNRMTQNLGVRSEGEKLATTLAAMRWSSGGKVLAKTVLYNDRSFPREKNGGNGGVASRRTGSAASPVTELWFNF